MPSSPGASAPGAAAAAEDVRDQRQPSGAGVDRLEDERRERHVAGGDRALRQQLAERLDDDVGQPLHRKVARAERRREGGVEEAALRRDDAHAAGEPGVLRHLGAEERAHGVVGAGVRARDRHVHARAGSARQSRRGRPPASRRRPTVARARAPAPSPRSPRRRGSPRPRPTRSGQARKAASARRAVCSSSASMPATTVVQAVARRRAPRRASSRGWQAASCASRSPSVEAGSRTLAAISSYSARTRRPASTSLRAGKISPSWKSSVHCALSVPGKRPPMSMWWAIEPAQATIATAGEEGREDLQVGRVGAAHVRVVGEERVARARRRRPTSRARPPARTASGRAARGSARSSRPCGRPR